jgi:hypothetical protein
LVKAWTAARLALDVPQQACQFVSAREILAQQAAPLQRLRGGCKDWDWRSMLRGSKDWVDGNMGNMTDITGDISSVAAYRRMLL